MPYTYRHDQVVFQHDKARPHIGQDSSQGRLRSAVLVRFVQLPSRQRTGCTVDLDNPLNMMIFSLIQFC